MSETVLYDYDVRGIGYSKRRQTDPRIARYIHSALGDARTVLNVGAGSGSYEPEDRYVVAVEPSGVMRSQRPRHLAVAIDAVAEALPFDDNAFDASMAMLTIHHWSDAGAGLQEMRRVTKGPVVICTFDTEVFLSYWVAKYLPEFVESDRKRFPTIEQIVNCLGGTCTVEVIPVPFDCADGMLEAFYGRPEYLLNDEIRKSQSIWGVLPEGVEERFVQELSRDIESGEWDRQYGHFRSQSEFRCALRLIKALP
jgi:SAM-dependent methyltransferase